ncbi:MAG: aspartate/glutamate racemase family protein, partial [Eubacterium sp.]|nr:aspartate/glutamate racemase family protein [Eubacterium sp.]
MAKINDPIAVFDSGMGGISVLREMVRLMPEEDFIYFGDSKNAPYGTKSMEEVKSLTLANIAYLLDRYHAKAIGVACNTATSAAVRTLRQMYPDVPAVFSNTGLEFPEVVAFVNRQENVTTIRPEKTFLEVVREEGYPLFSKSIASAIRTGRRLNLSGTNRR